LTIAKTLEEAAIAVDEMFNSAYQMTGAIISVRLSHISHIPAKGGTIVAMTATMKGREETKMFARKKKGKTLGALNHLCVFLIVFLS